jgi:hypothetical protein
MPAPGELRDMTLRELRAARKDMLSGPWKLSIRNQPQEVRRAAALRLADIEQAILELENAVLADIRDKLIENEDALLAGTRALAKARQNLAKVQAVLEAIGTLLVVAAKVAKFVATGR